MLRKLFFVFILLLMPMMAQAKLPELSPELVTTKMHEFMKAHATFKVLNRELVRRTLLNYLDELDPTKTYFIEADLDQWIHPTDAYIEKVLEDFNKSQFDAFTQINDVMVRAIMRRRSLEKQINYKELPKHVSPSEFKDMKWVKTEADLLTRLERIRSIQLETSAKINDEVADKALQRMFKRQNKYEEGFLSADPVQRERLMQSYILKAFASALDDHSSYLTPDEATQFMIQVQQSLSGIGAQLRDDLNGFTVVKMIEGGAAATGKELKVKDRIIAVNGEPVVGMDITDAVELIRGPENTPVTLTIIREVKEENQEREEKKDIVIKRTAVVLKESRYETSYEPFGDGIIAYLKLFSFYDDDGSSTSDLERELENLKKNHNIKGVILDLRYNSGGLLSQAVDVAGLFIRNGTVVSVKDDNGEIQHLRHIGGKPVWEGPLIVLINRATASASEIVAQTLQDYGRALIIGDIHSYGKGSFQTFTLNSGKNSHVNPQGEYKITRGRYYTVSGKTPQLNGVPSDIVVPGLLSESDLGEKSGKYPLENDEISPNFEDDLSDIPFTQREKVRVLYNLNRQQKVDLYKMYRDTLSANSKLRISNHKDYQKFLKELKKEEQDDDVEETEAQNGRTDLQLVEAYNIMKDLLMLQQIKK